MPLSTTPTAKAAPVFAYVGLIGGNVALALGPWLVRLADTGPVAAGFWRLFLALPALFLFARLRGERMRGFDRLLWATIALAGVMFAGDLASWNTGLLHTKLANATLFANASSLLLPLWGIMVARRMPAPMQGVALLLALAGAAMLMGGSYELGGGNLTGDLLCLFGGLCYTGFLIALQRARRMMESWTLLAMSSAAGVLPMLAFALLLGERILPHDWTPVVALAFSSQIVGQGLLIYSLAYFPPLVVGLALLIEPLTAALVGWLVYGERLTPTDMIGAVAIAAALVLVCLPARAKPAPAPGDQRRMRGPRGISGLVRPPHRPK